MHLGPLRKPLNSTLAKVLALLAFAVISAAHAQQYPSKSTRILVPYGAGGPTDAGARLYAEKLAARFGQAIVVENRPGGGTLIAMNAVASSTPDGYTLLFSGIGAAPYMIAGATIDPTKDLAPIAKLAAVPLVLIGTGNLPVANLKELVAYAKTRDRIVLGIGNIGGLDHLFAHYVSKQTGINILATPYGGTTAILPDVMAGRIDLVINTAAPLMKMVEDGKLKFLAAITEKRIPYLPNVPTVAESGVQNFDAHGFYGLWGPGSTPREIVARLSREIGVISRDADLIERLKGPGLIVEYLDTPEFTKEAERSWATMRDFVREAGLKQ